MSNLVSKFVKSTLTTSNWVSMVAELSLPSEVYELELEDTTGAIEIRNKNDTAQSRTYPQNVIFILESKKGHRYKLTDYEIRGTAGDVIEGEYIV